jgi:hypothetical protein
MLRIALTVLLPLVAPFLVYLGWVWLLRREGPEDLRDAPWVWILTASIVCVLAGLLYLYLTTGHDPGTKLVPPALIDGVVVPSHPAE